jgi:hypothetical protein
LEQLEGRLAPAVYRVDTFQDTPLANPATGQDAAGHVSLRSAVMAANANNQTDTILLGSGVYPITNGPIAVHGDIRIAGQGPEQTIIEAGHRDRVFEVDGGRLDLAELTLDGGSAATLLKGDVHLTNSQITENDVAVVVDALFAPKEAAPMPLPAATSSPTTPSAPPVDFRAPILPKHLVGPGGGSWTVPKDLEDAAPETHRAFWRVDADAKPDTLPQDKVEEMKQSQAQIDGEWIASKNAQVGSDTKADVEMIMDPGYQLDIEPMTKIPSACWIDPNGERVEATGTLGIVLAVGSLSARALARKRSNSKCRSGFCQI